MNIQGYLHVFLVLLLHEVCAQKNVGDSCVDEHTNSVGKCAPADQCNSAREDLQLNGVKPTFCAYTFNSALVCCRDNSNILQAARPSANPNTGSRRPVWGTSGNDNRRISEKKCDEYSRGVVETVDFLPLLPDPEAMSISAANCDYTGVELIVGGENANLGEFPHMAAIGWVNFDDGYSFSCGGSLISPRWVLTAGHCTRDPRAKEPAPAIVRLGEQNIDPKAAIGWVNFDDGYSFSCGGSLISPRWVLTAGHCTRDPRAKEPAPAIVRLGEQNIDPKVNDGANPVEIPIRAIHKHPEYAPPKRYNDIALLELAADVEFEARIRPACLWPHSGFGGQDKAIATGWGVTDAQTQKQSSELQKVSLSLLENSKCDQLLMTSRNRNWQGFIDSQLCAGELRGGKDTCQGDSGSPLQVASKENHCIFHVIGVTSFGHKCAESGKPAIYTRVSSYIDWIESLVWPGEH